MTSDARRLLGGLRVLVWMPLSAQPGTPASCGRGTARRGCASSRVDARVSSSHKRARRWMEPCDPAVLSISLGVLWCVALVAGYLPARRAARVDPVKALRAD